MNKLAQVRKALQEHTNIVCLLEQETNLLPDLSILLDGHVVIIHVAPKTGLYTVKELNAFLHWIVPGLEPTSLKKFRVNNRFLFMEFGHVCYAEEIGKEIMRREIVLSDESLFVSNGFVLGKCVTAEETKSITRRVSVCLYPDEHVAKASLAKPCFGDQMYLKELERYRSP